MKKINLESESDFMVADKAPSDILEKPQIDKPSFKKGVMHNNLTYQLDNALGFSEVPGSAAVVFPKKHKTLIAHTIPVTDLMIFELNADHSALKVEWSGLAPRLKEVFEEIVFSLPLVPSSNQNDDGCYTFSYSDDEYSLSVVSIVINGKAALFYRNVELLEN